MKFECITNYLVWLKRVQATKNYLGIKNYISIVERIAEDPTCLRHPIVVRDTIKYEAHFEDLLGHARYIKYDVACGHWNSVGDVLTYRKNDPYWREMRRHQGLTLKGYFAEFYYDNPQREKYNPKATSNFDWGRIIIDLTPQPDYVYAFCYTSCIYESAHAPISLHRTKESAYKAMRHWWLAAYNSAVEEKRLMPRHDNSEENQALYGCTLTKRGEKHLEHEAVSIRKYILEP